MHDKFRPFLNLLFRITAISALLCLFVSCQEKPKTDTTIHLRPGEYALEFHVGETEIPVRLTVDQDNHWSIHNWTERIMLDSVQLSGNQFHVMLPLFNTTLNGTIDSDTTFNGKWIDHSRDSIYEIAFTANLTHYTSTKRPEMKSDTLIYEAIFSPENEDEKSTAIGKFYRQGSHIVGTFMTESGDYRFLEGTSTDESIQLSTFDGTHLFFFCANVAGDQLTDGHFYSGNHWKEDWVGKLNAKAKLRNPDSLTFVKEVKTPFHFHVKNSIGDTVKFDSTNFAGKVTIVQLFGSWCPNCTDESMFLKELYEKFHTKGLEIIPVAFERTEDFEPAMKFVKEQFAQLRLEYPPYFGGKKGSASDVFPMLSKILSYPTLIVVDTKGQVQKIHTGFYGPGTGEEYLHNCAELSSFIESLLPSKDIP